MVLELNRKQNTETEDSLQLSCERYTIFRLAFRRRFGDVNHRALHLASFRFPPSKAKNPSRGARVASYELNVRLERTVTQNRSEGGILHYFMACREPNLSLTNDF